MAKLKIAKVISNAIYIIGVAIVLFLSLVCLFGSNEVINPDAMLPFTWREQAFIGLAFGTLPMLIASMTVYKFNKIKTSIHKKRNFILIFLHSFICIGCLLFVIGLLLVGMINSSFR